MNTPRPFKTLFMAGLLAVPMLAFNAQALNWDYANWSPTDVLTDSSGNSYAYFNDPNNWSTGYVPTDINTNDGNGVCVQFNQQIGSIIPCVITNDTQVGQLQLGVNGGGGTLIITNGANFVAGAPQGFANGVPNNQWTGVGFPTGPSLLYVGQGCTATFGSHLWVGQGTNNNAQGTVIVDGGSISVPNGQLGVGWSGNGGTNYLTLTNGGAAYLQTWAGLTLGEPNNNSIGILDIWAGSFVVVTNNQTGYFPVLVATNELIGFGGDGTVTWSYNPAANTTTILSVAPVTALTPVFSGQPTNAVVSLGGTATFGVTVSNGLACKFQWQFNSQPLTDGNGISGSKTATLSIAGVTTANTGVYSVLATNASNAAYWALSGTASLSSDSFNLYPVITINGIPGDTYVVEYATSLSAQTTWIPLATNTLGSFTQYVVDTNSPLSLSRFYRVVQQ